MQKTILNITNGDSAVEIMKRAALPGDFLPWRDVLYEGPVPDGLSLEALSEVRATFIIERGWGNEELVKKAFIDRDKHLKKYANYEKIILWFEHDLYDQLQILQVLDWFHQVDNSHLELSMICTEQYLGMCTPDEVKQLLQYETIVTQNQLALSHHAWKAFRSDTPQHWQDLLDLDTSSLPFLKPSIIRLLEEYPDYKTGLSRTAKQALIILQRGEKQAIELFRQYQKTEERKFLGDTSFWTLLNDLKNARLPLVTMPEGQALSSTVSPDHVVSITPAAGEVLSGVKHWLDIIELDKWIGGVHLTPGNTWCWDSASSRLQTGCR